MALTKPKTAGHPFARRQRGSAMLEVLGSLGIGAVVLGGIADQSNRYMDSTKASSAGEYHRQASLSPPRVIFMTRR